MDAKQYSKLIDKELQNLPIYVFYYSQQPNLSLTTVYQYLTKYRRFFDWLRITPADVENPSKGYITLKQKSKALISNSLRI